MVELTVALHYVFNTPDDKVSHFPSCTGTPISDTNVPHTCLWSPIDELDGYTSQCDLLAIIDAVLHQQWQ